MVVRLCGGKEAWTRHTVKCDNGNDETDGKHENDDGVNLESWRLIGVKLCGHIVSNCPEILLKQCLGQAFLLSS